MKRGRLPLTALRSFEAAGRRLSFKAAAEELFVSQAAISRQVRELEERTGKALFERRHRSVILTAEGKNLLEAVTKAFDCITTAFDEISDTKPNSSVFVSAEVAFGANWLGPHLPEFNRLYPDIEVLIDSDNQVIDLRSHPADLAIRYGRQGETWSDGQSQHIADVVMLPVLSPALLKDGPNLSTPEDLLLFPLIHEDSRDTWKAWFKTAGVEVTTPLKGPLFTEHSLVLQSAARGSGAALADIILAGEDIASGRLVRPFETVLAYGGYWLVARNFEKLSPAAKTFAGWLRETLREFNAPAHVT